MIDEHSKKDIFRLTVEGLSEANLTESGRWAKFLSILGFIYLGIIILTGGLTIMSMSGGNTLGMPPGVSVTGAAMSLLLFLAITFYPSYSLYKFGRMIKPSMATASAADFAKALGYLKNFFKYIGILWIIFLGIMAIGLVFILIGAMGSLI